MPPVGETVWVYPVGDTHTASYISLSKNFRKEYSFLLFSKAFIALYVFIYSVR